MPIEENLLKRINELIVESRALTAANEAGQSPAHLIPACIGWLAAADNAVERTVEDPNSGYRKRSEELCSAKKQLGVGKLVGAMAELLANLRKDAEAGLLSSVANSARAEVLDSFLDHAIEFHKAGYFDRAGVVAGVVFEDTIRKLALKRGLNENGEKLDTLISELGKPGGPLAGTKARRARAAAHVRTKATHAQWGEFDATDVEEAINLTRELIERHLDD